MGLTRPRAYQIFDIDYKQSVRVVTTSNVTLGGGAPSQVDGVSLSLNDRVLVTGQSTGSQNGLYYVTTVGTGSNGTWARSVDGNETGEIDAGMIVMVTEGTTYADTQWKLTTDDPIVIGTTALTFVQNYSANSISAGTSNVVVNSNANVTISAAGTPNVVAVTATGANIAGYVTATGNVTGNYILGNGALLTGVITSVANINSGTSNVTVVSPNGDITVGVGGTGNIGVFSTTGLAITGDLSVTGNATLSGNILGDRIQNGNTQIDIQTQNGNANITVGGVANVAVFSTAGQNVTGYLTASGNITGGNISTAGQANVTGNLTTASAVNFNLPNSSSTDVTISSGLATAFKTRIGTTATNQYSWRTNLYYTGSAWAKDDATRGAWRLNQVCLTGNANSVMQFTYAPIGTTDVNELMTLTGEGVLTVSGNVTGGNLSGTSITGTLLTAAQPNITSVGTLSSLAVTGNTTSGNFVGTLNGSGANVTSISATNISSGTLAQARLANSAVTLGSTALTLGSTVTTVAGLTSVTSTTFVGALTGAATTAGTVTTAAQPNITSVGTLSSLTVTANVAGGNLTTIGQVSASGNISGNYFIGNGSQLTGIAGGDTIGGNLVVLTRSGNVNFAITAGYLIVNTRASGNVSIAIAA